MHVIPPWWGGVSFTNAQNLFFILSISTQHQLQNSALSTGAGSIMSDTIPAVVERLPSESSSSVTSDILNLKDDEGWEDAEPEEENEHVVSLTDETIFPDAISMLEHCKSTSGLDFLHIRDTLGLDFYGSIKLVNFIRSEVKAGKKVSPDVQKADFDDEIYLKPVLEDDALLFNLDDLPVSRTQHKMADEGVAGSSAVLARVAELEEELRRTQSQFSEYREKVKQTLDERWNENAAVTKQQTVKQDDRDDDTHYFTSYSYNGTSTTSKSRGSIDIK